mmetsp:Transcript_17468/g.14567  ORF Transcript_17468/g.14567 Transcript_17468/m.14567 type:complete len:143 (-) Transcript_17468:278-706(-)
MVIIIARGTNRRASVVSSAKQLITSNPRYAKNTLPDPLTILGELPAAIIGFILCIDNSISAAAIARAFAAYMNVLAGEKLPKILYDYDFGPSDHLWSISILSCLLCILLGVLLYRGIKQTSNFNNWSTVVNMVVILVFIMRG